MGVIEFVKLIYGYEMQPDEVKDNRVKFLSLAEKGQLGQPDEPYEMDSELEDFCNTSIEEWQYPISFTEWLTSNTGLTAICPVAGYSANPDDELVYMGIKLAEINPQDSYDHAVETDPSRLHAVDKRLGEIAKKLGIEREPKIWLLLCLD